MIIIILKPRLHEQFLCSNCMCQLLFAHVDDRQIFFVNLRKESTYICKLMQFLIIVIEISFYLKEYLFKSVFRLKKQKKNIGLTFNGGKIYVWPIFS